MDKLHLLVHEDKLVTPGGLWTFDDFRSLTPRERAVVARGVYGASEPHCYGALQACRIRVAKLDANGSPSTGAGNGYVTDQLIDVNVDPEVEAGAKKIQRNGCGQICQTFRDCDQLTGLNFDMNLCVLDARLIQFLVGGSVILDLAGVGLGDVIGYEMRGTDDACTNGVSFELWQKAWDSNTQATPPFLGGTTLAYIHWVFPKTKWMYGPHKAEDDFSVINVKGYGEENPRITTNGPFDDWPADVATRGGITNLGGWFFDSAIPAAACATITVTSSAS